MLQRFFCDERGATAIEYAVIAALIFMAIVAAIIPIGGELSGVFNDAAAGFSDSTGSGAHCSGNACVSRFPVKTAGGPRGPARF
jgi:pilus assembly protein Flp/PilA